MSANDKASGIELRAQVESVYQSLFEAVAAADRDGLEALLSPGFQHVSEDGTEATRDEWIESVCAEARAVQYSSATPKILELSSDPDVTARAEMVSTGTTNRKSPFESTVVSEDTFVSVEGKLALDSRHVVDRRTSVKGSQVAILAFAAAHVQPMLQGCGDYE